jgi:KipI family sensor histidine kinase inhibitor
VTFADRIDERVQDRVVALTEILRKEPGLAVVEVVPATVTVAVHYRPAEIDYPTLRDRIQRILAGPAKTTDQPPGRLIEIPVVYDGPDLESVANAVGLSIDEVITRHQAPEYRVALLGFVPGWGYLTGLDPGLVLPRRSTPRPRVPAGSVAIAGEQAGVYPAATPGGWHLLGRTATRMFDPDRDPPALLAVGDRVRFVVQR